MKEQTIRDWNEEAHQTWRRMIGKLAHCREHQAHPVFTEGVSRLQLDEGGVPEMSTVNQTLKEITGWQGIPVEGLEENGSFFEGLANRRFPIGNFIRDKEDLSYTPAPDIFHDLYGHMPFFANKDYADFCKRFGDTAAKYKDNPEAMVQFGRLFWFGVEFPVVKTDEGRRIFGGGILSSFGESNYAVSDKPTIRPFNLKEIRDRPYKIDEFQHTLYELDSPEQLYDCMDEFERLCLETMSN